MIEQEIKHKNALKLIAIASSIYIVWVAATYILEGRIHLFQQIDPIGNTHLEKSRNDYDISSPQALHNMTAEQQAMVLAQIMFPPQWLKEHPEVFNIVIQLAPSRSATPEIIQ